MTNSAQQGNIRLEPGERVFQGNGFILPHSNEWNDETLYTLTGPVADGIRHNIMIQVRKDSSWTTVETFAEAQIASLEQELTSCKILNRQKTKLVIGLDAYRVIMKWQPTDVQPIYQEQIYVLADKTGYTLTASFSRRTRKTVGPFVERIMLRFQPVVQ